MTSISSVTTRSTHVIQAAQQRPPASKDGKGGDPLDSVTELLGKTKDELRSELTSGKSLDDVAAEQGVSHDALIAALKAGMPADAPTDVDPTQMLEQMASQVGGPRPPQPPAGMGLGGSVNSRSGVITGTLTSAQQNSLDQLSNLLGTDSDDLLAELQGGTDLLEMLQSKGITRSTASATVGEGLLLDARS